jgi:hypothetical protein
MDRILSWLAPILSALVICTGQLYLSSQFKRGDEKREEARIERAEIERKKIEQREAERTIILAMSRTMLLNNYEKCLNKGFYSVDERDVYSKLYEAYKDDGGNGVIDTIAEHIRKLPIEPPKKEE